MSLSRTSSTSFNDAPKRKALVVSIIHTEEDSFKNLTQT